VLDTGDPPRMSSELPPLFEYSKAPDRHDELRDDAGLRPHVRPFFARLAGMSAETLRERERFVRQTIAADGVTYNVYADALGDKRPWDLDVLPLLLPAHEHRAIAAGVAQRARLLDAVLADLLGPQRLLKEGLLPPALVFGQLGYPWAAIGIVPPGGVFLHLYAADIARGPDGRFWVLADRTQAPSGAAYALQNRITLSRAFPDVFRELGPLPLGGFFDTLQDSLSRLAPTRGEPPLVVLLSPGPYNETYFEHVFLARHLGFPLVLGQDLIVRRDAVFLKTLRGLRRVHGILRRLDDDYCDPVELRADSALGVPGLLAAARAGNVLLANAAGSGILETGALHAFLPALCERLLGEPLALPAVASWWCGEPPALRYACEHLDELVIKPTYSSMRMEPVFGHSLSAEARATMIERMRAQPHAYVAQEWVHLSRAPVRAPDGEEAAFVGRSVSLRVFAVASAGGYEVMPGALSRVAAREGDVVSMQWGGHSKDTWVLGEGPTSQNTLARGKVGAEDVAGSAVQIPSRVGESLFWMGRYSERCEAIARLLRAALVRVADAAPGAQAALRSIASACAALGILPTASGPSDKEPDFLAAVADPAVPGGLAANVGRLCSSAGQLRERMSTDNWHVLARLPGRLPAKAPALAAALWSLDEIMLAVVSLAGFAMDDMTRDESWRFLLLGRRLERLAHLAGVAGAVLDLPADEREGALEWLLEAANSIVTYRARYRRAPELLPVLHLVILDGDNPHAVTFQLRDLLRNLDASAEELAAKMPDAGLREALAGVAAVSLAAFEAEDGPALDAACASLGALLAAVRAAAFRLSDDLHRQFFSHAGTPAPLGL
jgi:uncharacterized circularly permuted ATP-grasp superfamily protein/uncharacterized alpha-E superfamily protein